MNTNRRDILIDTLIRYEQSMAQLYIIFGRAFPEERKSWADFAEEECRHAQRLITLKIFLKNEAVTLKETKIVTQRVNLTLEFIEHQIHRTITNKLDLREAILIALMLEDSAFESSFLLSFDFKTPKVRQIRRELIEATGRQKEKLVMWLDRIDGRMKMVA